MNRKRAIGLAILSSCILLLVVMYASKWVQPKGRIIREYREHKEAFEYIREYFAANDIERIFKYPGNPIYMNIKGSGTDIPLKDINDKLFVEYVRFLFDDLHYTWIHHSSTRKEDMVQLTFEKDTSKTYYYKEIVYCEDNEPPLSTGIFAHIEQIDPYWFYCEENTDEPM